jgi:hypothetical protein
MRAVARSGVMDGFDDHGRACGIMRDEVKALLFDARYAPEREAVVGRGINEGYVVASVAASCVLKIRAARAAA